MKAYIIFIFALIVGKAGFSNNIEAGIVLVSSEKKNVVLGYVDFERVKTTVTIKDNFGKTLYREKAKTPKVLQNKFSLANLQGNTFQVTVTNKFKVVKKTFTLDQGRAEALETSLFAYKPVFKRKGNIVWIHIPNPMEKEITINVKDNKDLNLISEIRSNEVVVKRKLDFSKYNDDAIILVDNGMRFTKRFRFY